MSSSILFGASIVGSLISRAYRVRRTHDRKESECNEAGSQHNTTPRIRVGRVVEPAVSTRHIVSVYLSDPAETVRCTVEADGETVAKHWSRYLSVDGVSSDRCGLTVINNCGRNIVFCWIHPEGKLFHFRPIPSADVTAKPRTDANDHTSRAAAGLATSSGGNTHTELTAAMHSFVLLWERSPFCESMDQLKPEDVVCVVRPEAPGRDYFLSLDLAASTSWGPGSIIISCRSTERHVEVVSSVDKVYSAAVMHGFKVRIEPGVFDRHEGFRHTLDQDLKEAVRLLPKQACELLQASTVFWINDSLIYGPVSSPVRGAGCCYHPQLGQDWLRSMGMSTEKAGGIEVYSVEGYMDDHARKLWGCGGLILHELSHAYHDKFCPDGYNNMDVLSAFERAMCNHLYDSVAVHGRQGKNGPIRAYACTNCMEYWAELSVAYMWYEDDVTEFNKWFPFNRSQLKVHDSGAYEVLHRLWNEPVQPRIYDA